MYYYFLGEITTTAVHDVIKSPNGEWVWSARVCYGCRL